LKQHHPYIHRDISWLAFNERVLQEAKDNRVPLLERLKFLAIYSSNLDEFFRVRVANHRNLLRVGKKTRQEFTFNPKATLRLLLKIVNEQQVEFSRIFEQEIVPGLNKEGIFLKRRLDLNQVQKKFVESYFNEFLLPYVQPVLLMKGKIRPFLNNASLYLTIFMRDKETDENEFAIVKVPSDHLPRFIELPSSKGRKELMILDDLVRHCLYLMFPGYDILDTYSIKLTRDAELYIDDEFSGDLIEKVRRSLTKRHVGPPSRFVYDREMPPDLLQFFMETFSLKKEELLVEGRYHNNFDFFKFPDFGFFQLKNNPLPPLPYAPLEAAEDFFTALRKGDHLINPPYHSYESVISFFEKAASDPSVTHIKITQYRVAKNSRIMNALMDAVEAGKKVFVFIEVKARFDEEANLEWGEKLSKAGVNVQYSLPGVKVHAKMALLRRMENGQEQFYAYLSTGNFHEGTAVVYSDFGFFTVDKRLVRETVTLFDYLETLRRPRRQFRHLLVGQFNLRETLEQLIEKEIENAGKGLSASITLKLNSLQDEKMINHLYKASRAGVKIRLIIRGLCSLIPGLPTVSQNIEAVSIVDRYLEHARIFVFHNKGREKIFLSSADWMTRNLSFRVETAFPIYDKVCRKRVKDILEIQWKDNVKARRLNEAQNNEYRKNKLDCEVQSQLETYAYFKRIVDGG
jgi:polyphosphate kinase